MASTFAGLHEDEACIALVKFYTNKVRRVDTRWHKEPNQGQPDGTVNRTPTHVPGPAGGTTQGFPTQNHL